MTEFQEKLLQTFKVFADFCKTNDLKYFAAYGTCLGAVRHHGFIPWDDDIDVYMMRDDYERMLSLRDQLDGSIWKISDFRDGGYPYSFGKFYATDCSIWELRQFPLIMGPWIDIFPIDEWIDDNEDVSKLYNDVHYALWNYRKALSSQTWSEIWYDLIHLRGLNGPIKLVKKCFYSPLKRFYFKKAMTMVGKMKMLKGDMFKDWNDPQKKVYKKEWFNSIYELPFEDTSIACPIGYEDYLTYEFGDYMTPPPPEKRQGGHKCFYIDLKNKKSYKEILTEMKQKGALVDSEAKPLSIRVLIDEILHRKGF